MVYQLDQNGGTLFVEDQFVIDEELEVKDFIDNEEWNRTKLLEVVSDEMIDHISTTIRPAILNNGVDKA